MRQQQVNQKLSSFFDKSLTSSQREAVDALEKFFAGSSHCFLLKGYAGTGKTFLLDGITKYLSATGRWFRLMAPTGRAARILSRKTHRPAYTIHKTIYAGNDLKEYKTKDEDGSETFKFYYDLKNNDDLVGSIYIVDEASMVSNEYNEGEFFRFGSGHLLQDLFRYVSFTSGLRHKIIFVGDTAQLPPVKSAISPALSRDYLQTHFKIQPVGYELTDVVRQVDESGILFNATQIRHSIRQNIYNAIDLKTDFPDVFPIRIEELLPRYLQTTGNRINGTTIIIVYSNRAAGKLIRNPKLISAVESLLIVAHKPAMNSKHLDCPNDDAAKILVRNWGLIGDILPECSGGYWECQ